jgi:hypothetical protein
MEARTFKRSSQPWFPCVGVSGQPFSWNESDTEKSNSGKHIMPNDAIPSRLSGVTEIKSVSSPHSRQVCRRESGEAPFSGLGVAPMRISRSRASAAGFGKASVKYPMA